MFIFFYFFARIPGATRQQPQNFSPLPIQFFFSCYGFPFPYPQTFPKSSGKWQVESGKAATLEFGKNTKCHIRSHLNSGRKLWFNSNWVLRPKAQKAINLTPLTKIQKGHTAWDLYYLIFKNHNKIILPSNYCHSFCCKPDKNFKILSQNRLN